MIQEIRNSISYKRVTEQFKAMPWHDLEFYQNWLMQSYYYTSHSTRMLAFAAGWTATEETSYYRRSLGHIREEQGHDLMALKDAANLGCNTQAVSELGSTRALWEPQFYKIQRTPLSLLGYILCLEMLAVDQFPSLLSTLKVNFPNNKHDFVRVHAEDDPEHVEEALKQISACNEQEKLTIFKNFEQTADLYRLMLADTEFMLNHQGSSTSVGHSNTYSTLRVEAQPTATESLL